MRRLCFISLVLLLVVMNIAAQDSQNLLTNPGFEDPFRTVSDGREVAEGWQPWNLEPGPNSPSYENAQPIYEPVAPDTTRIRSGSNAQQYFTDLYFTHVGGVYQRVTGITPGTELRFSVYAYVWSSSLDDPDVSEDPGGVLIEVGIDPTGGTDPTSGNIEWGVSAEQYDAYRQYSVIANATSNAVTVFVRSSVDFPQRNNYIFLDDAVLEVTTDSPVQPTDTSEPEPTDTPEPVPTDTPEPEPTDTPEPAPTNTPESPPTNTPEQDPTPTQEGETIVPPTNTLPVPIFPTNTSPPQIPTNTALPATATTQPTTPPIGGPATATPTLPFENSIIHTVRRGDTVGRLAELYGSTTQAIIQANNLGPNALIFVGQGLIIPVPVSPPVTNTPSPTPIVVVVTATPGVGTGGPIQDTVYIVQPGDTLLRIASRFNTTVTAIAQANGIANINLIRSGQRLVIPGTGGPVVEVVPTSPVVPATPLPPPTGELRTYVVQPGDNLYRISLRFGVSMADIARANGILNVNRLFAGQVLVIP